MRLLLLSGSTRRASTNNAALAAVAAAAPAHCQAHLYTGLAELPAFNPDNDVDPLPPEITNLRRRIATADALLICTPEYAGTLPGSFKNLLDWTVGGTEMSGRRVAWVNVAATGRGRGAIQTLETVLRYVGAALMTDACSHVPVPRTSVDANGILRDRTLVRKFGTIWNRFI